MPLRPVLGCFERLGRVGMLLDNAHIGIEMNRVNRLLNARCRVSQYSGDLAAVSVQSMNESRRESSKKIR